MNHQSRQTHKKMIFVSITYLTLSILVFTVSVFAWFTYTNVNDARLVENVSGVEAEYEFYVFRDSTHSGSTDLKLMENLCTPTKTDQCYEYVPNPTIMFQVDGFIAPGDRFSFALKIINVGPSSGFVDLELGKINSIGYDLPQNKIQIAFSYHLTKVSHYIDNVEYDDIKDTYPIQYQDSYFQEDSSIVYTLARNVPLTKDGVYQSATIVYFDFFFDPTIYGVDALGNSYLNSNIFMNQDLQIRNLYMTIHP